MFPQFFTSAGAAVAAVRLPQPANSTQGRNLLGASPKTARPVPPAPAPKHRQRRPDQSRYQAKCRVAMSF